MEMTRDIRPVLDGWLLGRRSPLDDLTRFFKARSPQTMDEYLNLVGDNNNNIRVGDLDSLRVIYE